MLSHSHIKQVCNVVYNNGLYKQSFAIRKSNQKYVWELCFYVHSLIFLKIYIFLSVQQKSSRFFVFVVQNYNLLKIFLKIVFLDRNKIINLILLKAYRFLNPISLIFYNKIQRQKLYLNLIFSFGLKYDRYWTFSQKYLSG